MADKNIYALPVRENGGNSSYYCLVMSSGTPTYSWVLIRGNDLLSTGVCADTDVDLMLDALRVDLDDTSEWSPRTIH